MTANLTHRATMLGLYQQLQDRPYPGTEEAELVALAGDAQRLREETFKIAFIGRFSVGKSQLINRLFLGEDVLTVNLKPTTARLLRIGYGPQPALWLERCAEDGTSPRKALVPPGGDVAAITAAIRHYTTHLGKPESGDADLFQLDWPDGQFFQDGVQLLDTIGTEDIDDRFIDETYAAIRQSDAVVMILSMLQPLTTSEQRFIDQHLEGTGKKVFLVVNKADGRSAEGQREVLDDLRQRFNARYQNSQVRAEDRIFAVSAKTGQGLDELRERLVRFVTDERLGEILRSHSGGLQARLQGWLVICQRDLKNHEDKKAGDESRLRETQDGLRALAVGLARDRDRLEDIRGELEDDLLSLINDLRKSCERRLQSYQLQANSVEIMTTDFGMFFKNEASEITDRLQRSTTKQLQRRLGALAGIDARTIEILSEGDPIATGEAVDIILKATGGGGVLVGGVAALTALQTALATPISWWAAGKGVMAVFAGALAPWALPAIIGGIFLIYGGDVFKRKWREQAREQFLTAARPRLEAACDSLKANLKTQLNGYVTQAWQEAERRIDKDRKALEQLLAETDLAAIEVRIADLREEEQRLTAAQRHLSTLRKEVD